MTQEARQFGSDMFAALANPARLRILEVLAKTPASVGDLTSAVGLKQPTVSQHLSALLDAGIVVFKRRGHFHIYSLRGPRIAHILELVEEFHRVHVDDLRSLIARQHRATL
jgi:DNA-binding transcriptional ArsR family regulator